MGGPRGHRGWLARDESRKLKMGLPGRLMLGAADVYTNFRDGGVLARELPLSRNASRA